MHTISKVGMTFVHEILANLSDNYLACSSDFGKNNRTNPMTHKMAE